MTNLKTNCCREAANVHYIEIGFQNDPLFFKTKIVIARILSAHEYVDSQNSNSWEQLVFLHILSFICFGNKIVLLRGLL